MTDEDFVNDIEKKQERTRADIRALKAAIDQLQIAVAENSKLLREIVSYQAERDEREAQQVAIAEDTTQIASSVVTLVEDTHLLNRELTKLVSELRVSVSVDASMNKMIAKIKGAGIAIDEALN